MLKAHHETKIALGSETTLLLVSEQSCEEIFRRLWLEVFRFEQRCSRFLPDSELSQFNRSAGSRQPVSPEFLEILLAASDYSRLTGGLYNPFILPALQRAGYVQSMVKAHKDDAVDDYRRLSVTSADKLEIGDGWARIPFGTAVDLGGCGKGFIADKLADMAEREPEVAGYWFSLGGDIVAGGRNFDGKPWTVWIATVGADSNAEPMAGSVQNQDGGRIAVATSAITARRGVKNGKAWHHIIDPTTGKPAKSDLLAATICDRSCLRADVFASCCIILGSSRAENFLDKQEVSGSLFQLKNTSIISAGNIRKG